MGKRISTKNARRIRLSIGVGRQFAEDQDINLDDVKFILALTGNKGHWITSRTVIHTFDHELARQFVDNRITVTEYLRRTE